MAEMDLDRAEERIEEDVDEKMVNYSSDPFNLVENEPEGYKDRNKETGELKFESISSFIEFVFCYALAGKHSIDNIQGGIEEAFEKMENGNKNLEEEVKSEVEEATSNVQNDFALQSMYNTMKNNMENFLFKQSDVNDLTNIDRDKSKKNIYVINYNPDKIADLVQKEGDIKESVITFLSDLVYSAVFDAKDQTEDEATQSVNSEILGIEDNTNYSMDGDINIDDDIKASLKNIQKLFETFEEEKKIDRFNSKNSEAYILNSISTIIKDVRNKYDNKIFDLTQWMTNKKMFDTKTYKYVSKLLVESIFRRKNKGQPVKVVDFDDNNIKND